MKATFNNREIDIVDMYCNTNDYPEFCDSFIESAYYIDSGKDLSEDDLDNLNQDSQLVYEAVMDRLY